MPREFRVTKSVVTPAPGYTGVVPMNYFDWKKKYYGDSPDSPDILKLYQAYFRSGGGQSNSLSINLPDPTPYFDPANIYNLFNTARGNLGRMQGSSVAGAQRTAAALGASGGYFNPAGLITAAGSQARAPYAQAFGRLEEGQASALQENQLALLRALVMKSQLEEESRQFNVSDDYRRQALQQQWEQFLRTLQFQKDLQKGDVWDFLSGLFNSGAVAGLADYYSGGGKKGGR